MMDAAGNSLYSRHVWSRHWADFLGFLQRVLLVKSLFFFLLILNARQTKAMMLKGKTEKHADVTFYGSVGLAGYCLGCIISLSSML